MAERAAVDALLADSTEARQAFFAALESIRPSERAAPGLVGDWSARELVAHLGYWVGHAVEAIHHAEQGRAADFKVGDGEVDARNAVVARIARETDYETVLRREAEIFAVLSDRLARLDPRLLDVQLADWGRLEDGIREDAPLHYREHTSNLLAGR